MNVAIIIIGIVGFFISLFIMYRTNHGIPGIQKYDPSFRLLDMQFRYNSNTLYNTFNNIGKEGMIAYKNYLVLDFCFIACFLIVMLAITLKVSTNGNLKNILIVLLVLRAVFDVIENTILISLLSKYPVQNVLLADICSWVTTIKFISLYIWLFGIVITLILKLFIK